MKGSHGGVLVAARSSLQLGAMVANVDDHKVEWRGHDWAACVVKAVRASYVYITAYVTSTADARCPEKVSTRQNSGLLRKQRREFMIAAYWNMEPEELETTGFLRLVGGCVTELPGESGTRYSGRSIDHSAVSKNFRQFVKNARALRGRRMWRLPSTWRASRQTVRRGSWSTLLRWFRWRRPSVGRSGWSAIGQQSMPFPTTRSKKWRWQACSGQRWVIPLSCSICSPSGRWLLSATSSQNVS